MASTEISLIVLRTSQMDKTLDFYRTLDLEFHQEQHGKGPIHYSCQFGNTVLEIYPGDDGVAPPRQSGGATMLGFRVASIDNVIEALRKSGVQILSEPKESAWGRRAAVMDCDGRAIELTQ